MVYNLTICYRPSRRVAIDNDITAALWKLVKLTSTSGTTSSKKLDGLTVEESGEDVMLVHLISRICRSLCLESEDEVVHKKLLQGILIIMR